MSKLSTHVLDTAAGRPAAGMRIDFFRLDAAAANHAAAADYRRLKTLYTNADGRTDELLLDAAAMQVGGYQLVFYVGDYFANTHFANTPGGDAARPFLDQVPVRFAIADAAQNYHVPLLVSPWSYTTYRGS